MVQVHNTGRDGLLYIGRTILELWKGILRMVQVHNTGRAGLLYIGRTILYCERNFENGTGSQYRKSWTAVHWKDNIRTLKGNFEYGTGSQYRKRWTAVHWAEHYLYIVQNLNVTLTRISISGGIRTLKRNISFIKSVFVYSRATPRLPMEEFLNVLWWLI